MFTGDGRGYTPVTGGASWKLDYDGKLWNTMTVDKDSGYTMKLSSSINWELSMLHSPYGQLDQQTSSSYQVFNITNEYEVDEATFLSAVYPMVECNFAIGLTTALVSLTTVMALLF